MESHAYNVVILRSSSLYCWMQLLKVLSLSTSLEVKPFKVYQELCKDDDSMDPQADQEEAILHPKVYSTPYA